MTLVLVGPPAAGKTSIGKRVAVLRNLPFIDTDARISSEHGPISDIFASHGEDHFRELERATVATALGENAVVSLGGGAVLNAQTRADLARHLVAYLTITADAVADRIRNGKRPLLVAGGISAWESLELARRPLYQSVADATWDTSTRPIATIAAEIAEWMQQQ